MAVAGRAQEVKLADEFLAMHKALSGEPPEFGPKIRGKWPGWEAVWPIADLSGVVSTGSLRIVYRPASPEPFTLVLVYRGNGIYRLDYVDPGVCHSNPFWAQFVDAPPSVCGPHVHEWEKNRDHILKQDKWELPCRVELQPQITKFEQAFAWFADRINLILTPDQRRFELPSELL